MPRHCPHGDASYVEVLTDPATGVVCGYRFGGDRPGPNVLAIGPEDITGGVFDVLAAIPSLPWMWGQIFLVNLDALQGDTSTAVRKLIPGTPFDETLLLPISTLVSDDANSVRLNTHELLHRCAALGLITGRGLPARQDWASDTIKPI